MCVVFIFIFSPEFIGDLMKIPALVQGGRVEGANRDTTAEIFYSTQINKGNNLHQEIFNWKNGRLHTSASIFVKYLGETFETTDLCLAV